ncbi:hypothetical protein OS493_005597 [Desmophyllum pertusum]|uniref:Uncharacterized protein n=1 Tax=Desmophyllum pertusum TaxID=174260 RepID=A0A9X0CPE8_9CNID|nr:hypothetical protein OS493_005597 [Desmophyllum pertusum]
MDQEASVLYSDCTEDEIHVFEAALEQFVTAVISNARISVTNVLIQVDSKTSADALQSTILSENCADGSRCQQQGNTQEDSASDILPSMSLLFNSEYDDGSGTEEDGRGGGEEVAVVEDELVKEEDKEVGEEVGDDLRLAKDADEESDQTSKLDEPVVEDLTPTNNEGCKTGTKRSFAFFKRQRKRSAVTPEVKARKQAFELQDISANFIIKSGHTDDFGGEVFIINTSKLPTNKQLKELNITAKSLCINAQLYIDRNVSQKYTVIITGGDNAAKANCQLAREMYRILKTSRDVRRKISMVNTPREFLIVGIPDTVLRQ